MPHRVFPWLIIFVFIAATVAFAIPLRHWSQRTAVSFDACVATNGDLFIAGQLDGTVDFGDTVVTSAGSRDVVVARYDEDGNTLWVRTAGDSGAFTPFNRAQGVVPSPDGGCVVVGEFSNELRFDSTHVLVSPTGIHAFAARYAADGSVMWATSDGLIGEYVRGAASDNTGGCYTLTTFFDSSAHVLLTRHDNLGHLRWALDGTDGIGEAISSDPDGNVIIAGYSNSPFTLADSTLSASAEGNFLAKLDSTGQVLWMRQYAVGSGIVTNDVMVDGTGAIYVCGSFLYGADIGDTTLVQNTVYFDGFLARHDADGNFEWAREIDAAGPVDEAEFRNMAITPEGEIFASARFFKSVIVEGDTLLHNDGHEGGLLLEYTSDGTLVDYLSTGSGGGTAANPRPIGVNANGTVFHYSLDDTLTGPNLVGYRNLATAVRTHLPTTQVELLPSYPNPFNPTTTVRFRLRNPSRVELVIFDVSGRRVRTLVAGHRDAGIHDEVWNGNDDRGHAVASGVYFVRLSAGRAVASSKVVLLK